MSSIRVVLGLVASLNLEVELDMKIAFLHGDLDEKIYMQQPEGFEAVSLQVEKEFIWVKASSKIVIQEV